MPIKKKDLNRAELVKAIIKQNGGKIFTVIAKRKSPKVTYERIELIPNGRGFEREISHIYAADFKKLSPEEQEKYTKVEENFMELTCRTGVKKDLKGGKSTIKHVSDLISVNLTNGEGYRCFSAFNVLELRASGTVIKFKEKDVLDFQGE